MTFFANTGALPGLTPMASFGLLCTLRERRPFGVTCFSRRSFLTRARNDTMKATLRANGRTVSLACLTTVAAVSFVMAASLVLSGCATTAEEAYGNAETGLSAYCRLTPEARAELRARTNTPHLIRCPGDP